MEQSHIHLFMCCLWLLLSAMGRQKEELCLCYRDIMVCKAKYIDYLAPCRSTDPCSRPRTTITSCRTLGMFSGLSIHHCLTFKIPDPLRKGYRLG